MGAEQGARDGQAAVAAGGGEGGGHGACVCRVLAVLTRSHGRRREEGVVDGKGRERRLRRRRRGLTALRGAALSRPSHTRSRSAVRVQRVRAPARCCVWRRRVLLCVGAHGAEQECEARNASRSQPVSESFTLNTPPAHSSGVHAPRRTLSHVRALPLPAPPPHGERRAHACATRVTREGRE